MAVKITVQPFGEYEGKQVNKYTITGDSGMQVGVINYGATITNIIIPDKNGSLADIVLGFESLSGYINAGDYYFGGVCGRYANRIANASFRINGSEYKLAGNNGISCLHGGFKGFDKVYWDAEILSDGNGVTFMYNSKDGEEGFPGNMKVAVSYRLVTNALHIEYTATTDKATPVNLTSHCYFNLSGSDDLNIKEHELSLNADYFVEVGADNIPTGNLVEVLNTQLDFRETKKLSSNLNGYDQTWVLKNNNGKLVEAAKLFHSKSGREMTVLTTKPGIHFYNGYHLKGNYPGTKKGKDYQQYAGLCLEAQHFPDSPNHSNFPNTVLAPGEVYNHKTIYSFEHLNKN